MKHYAVLIYAVVLLTGHSGSAQEIKLDEKKLVKLLKQDISLLASDKFEGRETGTKGEQLTINYIAGKFKSAGLEPKGTDGFIQPFTFTDGLKVDSAANKFVINNTAFKIGTEFYPLPYSANGKVDATIADLGYGIHAPDLNYDDYKDKTDLKGKIFLIETGIPGNGNDTSKLAAHSDLRTKINHAASHGAAAVIFINSNEQNPDPEFKHRELIKIAPTSIPVIFAKGAAGILLKLKRGKTGRIETAQVKTERTGHNVAGFLDNQAPYTVIIGAHLDHLGYGDAESSLHKGGPSIHNGADDNASGTAAVIELATILKAPEYKSNNYLFICFSGEEMGLIGSGYFAKNPTIDLSRVNYMINMDMIGRLSASDKTLSIYGTGTSPVWKELLPLIQVDSITIKTTESGIGPSDHTSFYLKDIPVLHFFSGFHPDYHKPSDDEEKINYEGEVSILRYILTLIARSDKKGKLIFTKTKEEPVSSKNTVKPRVTMGVIPDYMYSAGDGMKIDGVTPGKPAEKAGLKANDIIMQIGDAQVVDMPSYMKSLSPFKPGDTARIRVKRGNAILELEVIF